MPDVVKLNQIRPVGYTKPHEWRPRYTSPGDHSFDYREDAARSSECPQSIVMRHQWMGVLYNYMGQSEYLRSRMNSTMGGGSGPVALYGPDLSQWPSFMVDAMDTYLRERESVDYAAWRVDNPKMDGR